MTEKIYNIIFIVAPILLSALVLNTGVDINDQLFIHFVIFILGIRYLIRSFVNNFSRPSFTNPSLLFLIYIIYLFINACINKNGNLGMERFNEWAYTFIFFYICYERIEPADIKVIIKKVLAFILFLQFVFQFGPLISDIFLFGSDFIFLPREGLFKNTNLSGFFTLLLCYSFIDTNYNKKIRYLLILIWCTSIILTASRSALLGAIIFYLLNSFLGKASNQEAGDSGKQNKRKNIIKNTSIIAGIIIILVISIIIIRGKRVMSLNYITNIARVQMLKKGIKFFIDKPLTGWGIGSSGLIYPQLLEKNEIWELHFHNIFLQHLVEEGVIGTLIFIAFLIFIYRALKDNQSIKILYTSFILISLFDELLWTLPVRYLFFAILAMELKRASSAVFALDSARKWFRMILVIFYLIFSYYCLILPAIAEITFRKALTANKIEEKEQNLHQAYTLSNSTVHGLFYLNHLIRTNKDDKALSIINKLIADNRYDVFLLYTRAWICINNGDIKQGAKILENCVQADPGNVFAPSKLDYIYVKRKHLNEDISNNFFNETLKYFYNYYYRSFYYEGSTQGPSRAHSLLTEFTFYDRMYVYYANVFNTYTISFKDAEEMIRLDRLNPEVNLLYGVLLFRKGDKKESENYFNRALKLKCNNPLLFYYLSKQVKDREPILADKYYKIYLKTKDLIKEPYNGIINNVYRRKIKYYNLNISSRKRPDTVLDAEEEILERDS
ncbi:MAG: O-antigen ligase family protein [Candidatus Hydrogenedentota bacterium]